MVLATKDPKQNHLRSALSGVRDTDANELFNVDKGKIRRDGTGGGSGTKSDPQAPQHDHASAQL